MFQWSIEENFRKACPDFCGIALESVVVNTQYDEALWREIASFEQTFREEFQLGDINERHAVRANRMAYKATGKDPNRYRPSAESLCRRVLRGLPLYQISTVVDLINLLSLKTGYSIGGFDAAKIVGDRLTLGIGREGEPYEGIGRGALNIAGMPVYRDASGGIATPTSDHERTKISDDTTRLLMIINAYDGQAYGMQAISEAVRLLRCYASAEVIQITFF